MRWTLLAGVVLVLAFHARRFVLSAVSEYRSFHPERNSPPLPNDEPGFALEEVSFPDSAGRIIRGWLAPGTSNAAIVVLHGGGGDRRQMLPAARALATGGYTVLLFDWPGHGESEGVVEYGASERTALRGALVFLHQAHAIDTARIGVYGFSLGGYIALQTAATDPRIAAVAVMAAPNDILEQAQYEYRHGGFAAQWGARLGLRIAGMDVAGLRPRDVVGDVAPRPILIINGEADEAVSPAMARELYERARSPRELWLIPGAGHQELVSDNPAHAARLQAFFDAALRPERTVE